MRAKAARTETIWNFIVDSSFKCEKQLFAGENGSEGCRLYILCPQPASRFIENRDPEGGTILLLDRPTLLLVQ